MLLQQNPNLRGTLVKNETGSPFSFKPETAANRTTAKPTWVPRQSGERADFIAQELGLVSTSTTIPSTELHLLDDKMIDWGQNDSGVYLNGFVSHVEDSVCDPPTGTLTAAIFDAQLDLEMGLGDMLQLPSPPGSPSIPPSMTVMMNSVLPSERPFSPSEFLHKPAPSPQPQLWDSDISPEENKTIDEILTSASEEVKWDSSLFDLALLSQDGPDTLECLVQECGIEEETKEKGNFHLEENGHDILPTATTQQAVTAPQPPRHKRDSVGPMRIRKERRVSRRPARFRDNVHLDEDMDTLTATEASASVDSLASTSDTTPTGRNCVEELSYEEKYIRSRQQNNLASKRCREKRKAKYQEMGEELKTLEERNNVLKDKVAKLTSLRDQFKKFVNEAFIRTMTGNKTHGDMVNIL